MPLRDVHAQEANNNNKLGKMRADWVIIVFVSIKQLDCKFEMRPRQLSSIEIESEKSN